ncbi:MAG: hypothetical protein COA74_01060 [Gammaproteobacteria bacterium]|nr:MAG: hypothetical protein COA74_01060 [Gammaproteobacteria bacterium]
MTFNSALLSLIGQIGIINSHILIDWKTVQQWPSGALDSFIQTGLITTASRAKSIECHGCENHCYMDVLRQTGDNKLHNRTFIVCDDPVMQSQMGKIEIPLLDLQQWKSSVNQLASVIAGLLDLDHKIEYKPDQVKIQLGMLKGLKGRRWISLNTKPLSLEINSHNVPLNEILFFEGEELHLDHLRINDLLNRDSLNKAKKYEPSTKKREARKLETQAMYQDWKDEYIELKKVNPDKNDRWCSLKIAKMGIAQERDSETIRRYMKS